MPLTSMLTKLNHAIPLAKLQHAKFTACRTLSPIRLNLFNLFQNLVNRLSVTIFDSVLFGSSLRKTTCDHRR